MKEFNNWYNLIKEQISEPTVATNEPTVAITEPTIATTEPKSNRDVIINDVDSIMTSLETLSNELKEQLINEEGLATVAAAGAAGAALVGLGMGAKKLYDASVTAPKARKAQAKVNVMNLKVAGVENMISSADKEQKDKLKAKLDAAKEAAKELQSSVDDRYANSSGIVKKALSSEKAKGKMEVLKASLGDSSPEQQKQIKDQLVKLKNKIAKDDAAFQKEVKGAKEETPAKELNKVKELTTKDGKKASTPEQDKVAKMEGEINQYTKNIDETNTNIKKYETKIRQLQVEMEKATDKQKFEQGIEVLQKKIKADKEDVKEMQTTRNNLKKQLAKIAPKESLVIRANDLGLHELATEILEKESWQLSNTKLYSMYNEQLTKLESVGILNESKYVTTSIKDRFSRLL
jgi:chromosome segregation ATPase